MTKSIRTFSFNWIKDEVAHGIDLAIVQSPYIITQKELEYFLSVNRIVQLTKDYVKQKHNFNLKTVAPFGYTIEKFIEEIKKYPWYSKTDEKLEQLLTLWPISGSVLCEIYKKYQVQQRGKKLKKKKPTRKQRFFPVMKNTELFVLEQRIKLHRVKLRNAVLKYCQAKKKLKMKEEGKTKKSKNFQEEDDEKVFEEDFVKEEVVKSKPNENDETDIYFESTVEDNVQGSSSPVSNHGDFRENENYDMKFEPITKKSSFALFDDVTEWNGRREKIFVWD